MDVPNIDTKEYKRRKLEEMGLSEEQIQKIDEIYQLIDEYQYWRSQYYQRRSSPSDTIDEVFAALEQVHRRVNKLLEKAIK